GLGYSGHVETGGRTYEELRQYVFMKERESWDIDHKKTEDGIEMLEKRAKDKDWIREKLKAVLLPGTNPIDRSEDIDEYVGTDTSQFAIVEGMKSVGKTAFLLNLC
ncbi:MAG: hypothetical protein J0651_01240, partial [Actinobacteria bacterium]|nr:hypothetical protein [Actinomycetota bacterium]